MHSWNIDVTPREKRTPYRAGGCYQPGGLHVSLGEGVFYGSLQDYVAPLQTRTCT